MTRIPIRLRLTLAFALAMAIVLAATGVFLYVRLSTSLDEAIEENLQARTAELVPRVANNSPSLEASLATGLIDPDERFIQILDQSGRIIGGTPQLDSEPVLGAETSEVVVEEEAALMELEEVAGVAGRARVLVTPVETSDGTRLLIVGTSLEDRDETIRGFVIELLIGGPVALVLASLLGYALATAALRPVDAMRTEAAAISGSEPGRRLPLPSSQDEVYRLGETLNEMLGRLEAALERERGFVADAGHELRTPLASLKTELELALRHPRTGPELEDAIRSAAEETDRLARLAEDLLLLARSDQRQLPLRREELSAKELLRRVAERFARRADSAGRSIEVVAPAALELEADSARLEQALGNLVENALNHGGGPVLLSAAERDGRIELHVSDKGDGFPPEFLAHAFDRFSRADEARTGKGSGLGLTIASAIAQAHGGSAHAANREGEGAGADVWLSIPKP